MTAAQMKTLTTIIGKLETLQHRVPDTDKNRRAHEALMKAKNELMRVWE
jgi:hypothetical protein